MKVALVLACDDNFVAYASVIARRAAILSSDSFPIIIVSDGVTDENKKLAQSFCSRISFIEASQVFGDTRFHTTDAYRRASYLRLYLDEILADFDRIVYLDSDVTPLTDLSPLIGHEPKGAPMAATYGLDQIRIPVHDRLPLSPQAGYLQGGLQIFNVKAMREEGVFKEAIRFAGEHPELCVYVDQDALNVALQGRWQVLDWRWNVMSQEVTFIPRPHFIRHHGGEWKPWTENKFECEPSIVKTWCADLSESPWPWKYIPARKGSWARKHIRPTTRTIEARLKAASHGDFRTAMFGEKADPERQRYLIALPGILSRIDDAALHGRLGVALRF